MVLVGSARTRRWYLRVAWVVVCAGVALQVLAAVRIVLRQGRPAWDAVGVLLSYFTVLTNLLAAAVLAVEVLGRAPERRWWVSASAGVAVQMALMGMVFHLFLREFVNVTWRQRVLGGWMHYADPTLYLLWWLLFVVKGRLQWRDAFVWVAYPAAYVAMVLVRGAISGGYPYWFVDVGTIGYAGALQNSVGYLAASLVVGLVAVFVDRLIGRPRS